MRRNELTDTQREQLQPLLPPQRHTTGRPAKGHRAVVNGILWRCKTGAPRRDLPKWYGPWQTVYSRFRRLQQAGIWERVLAALQTEVDAAGALDWSLHFVEGRTVWARPHAVGAKKGR